MKKEKGFYKRGKSKMNYSTIVIVTILLLLAMMTLAGCGDISPKGSFYTLQEAFDQGLLTIDDLKSIAYYQSVGKDDFDIVPIPKNPETLKDETVKDIKYTYLTTIIRSREQNGKPMYPNATVKDIDILGYYGTYCEAVAIKISDKFSGYAAVEVELVVENVTFTYSGVCVSIWKAY